MSFDPTTHKDGGGTFGYMAPELWNGKHTKEADIFAFGMVVYEVVTGTYAFGRRGLAQHRTSSSSRRRPNTPEDPVGSGFGEGTWEFIEKCWNEIPQGRPTARDTSMHFELVAATSRVVGPSSAPSTLAADSESFLNSSGRFDKYYHGFLYHPS
jgi:serine/threonine protein kinase